MKVVLLETMDHVGAVGDIVNVKRGFARNFLFPRNKAIAANSRNLKHVTHQKLILDHKLKRARKAAEDVQAALEGKGVTIRRKSGEKGKLFGSVTSLDIANALRDAGVIVNRRFIELEGPIKQLGSYSTLVKLDGGLQANVKVEVVAEEE